MSDTVYLTTTRSREAAHTNRDCTALEQAHGIEAVARSETALPLCDRCSGDDRSGLHPLGKAAMEMEVTD